MARFRKFCLLFSTVLLLLGCAETTTDEYQLAGYQAASWQWTLADPARPEISQSDGGPTADANSIQTAPDPAAADRARMQTGAIIAVLGLIALLILADDSSACSGSGCGSSVSTN